MMFECKYCRSLLVVVGCACCCFCVDIAGGVLLLVEFPLPPATAGLVIKCKIKPPCHSHGCRNTWQYDTYYQHCWWESFVRTYGEDKGGCQALRLQPKNKVSGIRRDCSRCNSRKIKSPGFEEIALQWRLTGDSKMTRQRDK